jgi:hypothetical protein
MPEAPTWGQGFAPAKPTCCEAALLRSEAKLRSKGPLKVNIYAYLLFDALRPILLYGQPLPIHLLDYCPLDAKHP